MTFGKAHLLAGAAMIAQVASASPGWAQSGQAQLDTGETGVAAAAQVTPAAPAAATPTEQAPATTAGPDSGDIIVTAQKREQSVNKVGMSITAQTGDQLLQQGIRSVADLAKVVPGFTFQGAPGLAPIYSIRGIGFHDLSLASGPTVAVYSSEVPIPFGFETVGADFDIERVEVLKGPQGTLFGQNSTGGAVNYVMARPTRDVAAGLDVTYGRFATSEVSAFLSGPVSDTMRARVAVRSIQGSGWQQRYGPVPPGLVPAGTALGRQNQLAARFLLEWQPVEELTMTFNVNTRRDKSETQAPQIVNYQPSSSNPLSPDVLNFPLPPRDNRAASWDPYIDYAQNNRWKEATARIDYDAGFATFTSISALQRYKREAPAYDYDGTPYNVLRFSYFGDVDTFYQELRAAGDFGGRGSWIAGANYERDETSDTLFNIYPGATSRILFGLPNTGNRTDSTNKITTKAVYGNVEYPVLADLNIHAGLRYTKSDRDSSNCARDPGDGGLAAIFTVLQRGLAGAGVKTTPVVNPGAGGCVTLDANFLPGLFTGSLNEDNVSWRVGADWTVTPGTLVYANVSKGYKSGSFPLAPASTVTQYIPVTQEELLAYEIGFKSRVTSGVQLNAAAFYYDYTNKQITGSFIDPIFGRLTRLVSIPESRVYGFEASAELRPVRGLTLTPGVSYVNSRILGNFVDFTPLATRIRLSGEPFPYAPRWQVTGAAEYKWSVLPEWNAFVGANAYHQSETYAAFGQLDPYRLKPYTLVDLRAGVESASGTYRLSVWGTNVFDTYYWTNANRNFDVNVRSAGQPARYGVTLSYRYR